MSAAQPARPVSVAQPARVIPTPASRVVARTDNVDWATEYGYVVRDIRHLLVVSAGLFAALLIIGYFI